MHLRGVSWTLGILLILYGGAMFIPVLVSLYYHAGHEMDFFQAGLIVALLGGGMVAVGRSAPQRLSHRDGFLIVAMAWVILSILGAVPFWTTGTLSSFVDAMFESSSGLTTTGATVLSGLDHLPKSILFWRSIQQWLGGMGIVVLAVAVMPLLGVGGLQLFKAETPGPVKDKLTARVTETAKVLWSLYVGLTIACALAYVWGGMSIFDAINHAMCTMATGGFSTHDASFGYFSSPLLRGIAIVFMVLAGISFTLHFTAVLHGFSIRAYFQDEEFRFYIGWMLLLVVLCVFLIKGQGHAGVLEIAFSIVSTVTTTGFVASDYSQWPPGTTLLLLIAMFVGGSAGSTSGGMKVVRVLLLFRQGVREMVRLVHPHAIVHVQWGGHRLKPDVSDALWGFAVLYLVCYITIAILVAFSGVDIDTAFTSVAACITNTGPGFGQVGPEDNYAGLPSIAKTELMFAMVLGRLEIYTFFVLLVPSFWRK